MIMILGNKRDLEEERKVPTNTACQIIQEYDTIFAEVSAKTGIGIDEVRETVESRRGVIKYFII